MRMKLILLLATTLLFYTQATEEKKCKIKEYVITDNKGTFSESQQTCRDLQGEIASEDLKDSENAKKVKAIVNDFRQTDTKSYIWLGITVADVNEPPNELSNDFVFSDGSDFDDTDFVFKWLKGMESEPDYSKTKNRCSTTYFAGKEETMASYECDINEGAYGMCKIYEQCEGENSASTKFELSRANLLVFALFMACSVLKTFYGLVGMVF